MALLRFDSEFDPVHALLTLQRELERSFERPWLDFGPSGRGVFPPLNVFSDKDSYVVRLEVPGVVPKDLKIESQGRTLVISGKRETPLPAGGGFHRRERGAGEFSRSIQLPDELDLQKAEATCRHGILSIQIPKREEVKPRQITVQAD
jgi:HSP20 family protein